MRRTDDRGGLRVVLSTPSGVIMTTRVGEIVAPTSIGRRTIVAGRGTRMYVLTPGTLLLRSADHERRIELSWGTLLAAGNVVRILAHDATPTPAPPTAARPRALAWLAGPRATGADSSGARAAPPGG